MRTHSTIEERVEYGLDTIPADEMVSVPLRDLKFVHALLGELVSFFHQPLHAETIEQVHRFVGDRESGALHLLWEAYYRRMGDMVTTEVLQDDGGRFEHPLPPGFHKVRS